MYRFYSQPSPRCEPEFTRIKANREWRNPLAVGERERRREMALQLRLGDVMTLPIATSCRAWVDHEQAWILTTRVTCSDLAILDLHGRT